MKVGLLWYDGDPKVAFVEKVARVARRYREKFGREANVCYVHPSTLVGVSALPGDMEVLPSARVQRDYFWVGVKDV